MKRHSFDSLAAASLLILSTAAAYSQQTSKPPASIAPPTVVPVEKRFDIQLDGGMPAQEAVALIADKLKQSVNVIFTGNSDNTPLPALRLHQVSLPEFFAAIAAAGQIEAMNGRAGYAFAPVDGAPNIYTFTVQSPPQPPPNLQSDGGVVLGSNFGEGAPPPPPAPEKLSLFFDLATVLNKQVTIEDITTAVRTAWTAAEDGKEPPPEALKFHQETKLLIATGYPRRLAIVTDIVKLLQQRNMPSADDKQREIDSVRRQSDETLRQTEREVAEVEDQYRRAMKKLDQAEAEKEVMVKELRSRIAELEIELAKRQKTN